MKINKRTREQAADICQLAASNCWVADDDDRTSGLAAFAWDLNAYELALNAWKATGAARAQGRYGMVHEGGLDAPWAEAESLLRTGWSP